MLCATPGPPHQYLDLTRKNVAAQPICKEAMHGSEWMKDSCKQLQASWRHAWKEWCSHCEALPPSHTAGCIGKGWVAQLNWSWSVNPVICAASQDRR